MVLATGSYETATVDLLLSQCLYQHKKGLYFYLDSKCTLYTSEL